MSDEAADPVQDSTDDYGERFLKRYYELTGSRAPFNYRIVQAIKGGREAFLAALREEYSMLPYAAIQRVREAEPEAFVEEMILQRTQAAAAVAIALAIV